MPDRQEPVDQVSLGVARWNAWQGRPGDLDIRQTARGTALYIDTLEGLSLDGLRHRLDWAARLFHGGELRHLPECILLPPGGVAWYWRQVSGSERTSLLDPYLAHHFTFQGLPVEEEGAPEGIPAYTVSGVSFCREDDPAPEMGIPSAPGLMFDRLFAAQIPRVDAERRAYELLAEAIGVDAAAKVAAGGGYEIPSRRWRGRRSGRSYLVRRAGRVVILENGLPVGESCMMADCQTPWPDQVLHKIKAIQADETVIFATGNVAMFYRPRYGSGCGG